MNTEKENDSPCLLSVHGETNVLLLPVLFHLSYGVNGKIFLYLFHKCVFLMNGWAGYLCSVLANIL